jgi:hypothetical protein
MQRIIEMTNTTLDQKRSGFKVKFFEDPRVTALLNELKIEYETDLVTIEDIDLEDLDCQTRLNVAVANSESVNKYSDDMLAGDQFPMIVIARRNDGMYRVVCGNHRVRAIALTQYNGSFEAIILGNNISRDEMRALATRDNASHGDKTAGKESMEIAVRTLMLIPLHDSEQEHADITVKNVGLQMRIKIDSLWHNYRAAMMRAIFKTNGKNISRGTHIHLLGRLWTNWMRTGSIPVLIAVHEAIEREISDEKIVAELVKKASAASLPDRIKSIVSTNSHVYSRPIIDVPARIFSAAVIIKNSLSLLDHPGNINKEKIQEIVSLCNDNARLVNEWSNK